MLLSASKVLQRKLTVADAMLVATANVAGGWIRLRSRKLRIFANNTTRASLSPTHPPFSDKGAAECRIGCSGNNFMDFLLYSELSPFRVVITNSEDKWRRIKCTKAVHYGYRKRRLLLEILEIMLLCFLNFTFSLITASDILSLNFSG